MKQPCPKILFYFLILLLAITFYQPQAFTQNNTPIKEKLCSFTEKINFASEQYRLKVTVFQENSNDGLSMWSEWVISSPRGYKKLNCDLSSMIQVSEIKASPNGQYLAIISVGEGHPILDIVDLQALLINQECKTITTINPYPGTVNIEKWKNNELIITSSTLLTHKIDEQYPIEFFTSNQETFLLNPETQVITGLSSNAKNPIQYFINLLSDSENKPFAIDILGLLRAQEAIPNLQKMLSQETDPEIIEKLKAAIKQITE